MEANARTWPGRLQRSPYVFLLAVVAALALLVVSELAYWRAVRGVDDVRQREDVRAAVQSVLHSMAEAESGEWRYWLTGRAQIVHEVHAWRKGIDTALTALEQRAAAEPAVRADVDRLKQRVQQRLAAWDATRVEGTEGGARIAEGAPSPEQLEAIRSLSMQIVAHETQSAQALRADLLDGLLLLRIGVAALLAVTLLAVAMSRRHAAALEAQRDEQRRAVQAERDQLERLVRQRTEELTELTRHLEWAAEDARDRLAGALHDGVGALLTAAKLDAARLKARLAGGMAEATELGGRIAHLETTLDDVITLKRQLIEELRPSALQHLGLVPALEALVAGFSRRTGLEVQATLTSLPLAPEVALTGYRLVQEALENVERHAGARQVAVRLVPEGSGCARLEVQDDGHGFDPALRRSVSHGLVGLRYRVQVVHGEWRLDTVPGQGTRVAAVLPLVSSADLDEGPDAVARCQAAPTGMPARH